MDFAVGGAMFAVGARGKTMAIVAAAITLLSIIGGKYVAVHWSKEEGVREYLTEQALTEANYNEAMQDVTLFALLKSEEEYPAFTVERQYTPATGATEVTPEEIESFKTEDVPSLQHLAASKPTFNQWKAETLDFLR